MRDTKQKVATAKTCLKVVLEKITTTEEHKWQLNVRTPSGNESAAYILASPSKLV